MPTRAGNRVTNRRDSHTAAAVVAAHTSQSARISAFSVAAEY
jgi:hypothetical protein